MHTMVRFRWFDNIGVAAEARCPSCTWVVTTTDPVLMDLLYMDANDHMRECVTHGCQ